MTLYSQPITKHTAAEYYTRVYSEMPEDFRQRLINRLAQTEDVKFMKDFNRIMNLRLRMFAPGMYQVVYEN
jgi:hypothetical protein